MERHLSLVFVVTVSCASAEFLDAVSRVTSKGKSVYVPVKRERLQEIIDTFTGPTLYMPDGPVMPGQPEGTHPMWIDVAEVTFKDFVEEEASNPNSYVSTVGMEITVIIPYLALTHNGPPAVNLGVAVLYDAHRRGIPQPDFLFNYIAVEQIMVNENTVTITDGKAEITIDITMGAPCVPPQAVEQPQPEVVPQMPESDDVDEVLKRFSRSKSDIVKFLEERDDTAGAIDDTAAVIDDTAVVLPYVGEDISGAIFSLGGYPYVDFCWFYKAGKPRFCLDVEDIRYAEAVYGGNVCAMWSSKNEKYCASKAGEVSVSGWFRHIIPIGKATQTLGADQYVGDYSIGLKFPCVYQ